MFTELEAWDLVTQILSGPEKKPRGFAGSKKATGVFVQRLDLAFRAFKIPTINMDPFQDLKVGIRDNVARKDFTSFMGALEEMLRTAFEQAHGGASSIYVRSATLIGSEYIKHPGGHWLRLLQARPGSVGLDRRDKIALILHVTDWPWGDQEMMSFHNQVEHLFERMNLRVVYVSAEKDGRPCFTANGDRDWIVLGYPLGRTERVETARRQTNR